MIPACASYVAVYKSWGKETDFPVEGWDDDGSPLIYAAEQQCLVKAQRLPSFERIEPAADRHKVAVLPPGEWRIIYRHDDGTEEEAPIIGWAVAINGWATPIVVVDLAGPLVRPLVVGEIGWRLVPPPLPQTPETAS